MRAPTAKSLSSMREPHCAPTPGVPTICAASSVSVNIRLESMWAACPSYERHFWVGCSLIFVFLQFPKSFYILARRTHSRRHRINSVLTTPSTMGVLFPPDYTSRARKGMRSISIEREHPLAAPVALSLFLFCFAWLGRPFPTRPIERPIDAFYDRRSTFPLFVFLNDGAS